MPRHRYEETLTPLQEAAEKGQADVARDLLGRGTDPFQTGNGSSYDNPGIDTPAVVHAADNGKPDTLAAFLDRIETMGALDSRQKGWLGEALAMAVKNSHRDLYPRLLALGADPFEIHQPSSRYRDREYHQAAHIALKRQDPAEIRELLGGIKDLRARKVTTGNRYSSVNPVEFTVSGNLPTATTALLGLEPELVNAVGEHGKTPLAVAAQKGFTDIAAQLLQSPGIDPYIPDSSGHGVIAGAVLTGLDTDTKTAMIDLLVDAEPGLLTATGEDGGNVFHDLAGNGAWQDCADMIEYLLKKPGAKDAFDTPDAKGRTPLFLAALATTQGDAENREGRMPGLTDAADVLLAAGADPNMSDRRGWTPLDRLSQHGDTTSPMVKLLITSGGIYKKQLPEKFNAIAAINQAALENGRPDVQKSKPRGERVKIGS